MHHLIVRSTTTEVAARALRLPLNDSVLQSSWRNGKRVRYNGAKGRQVSLFVLLEGSQEQRVPHVRDGCPHVQAHTGLMTLHTHTIV